MKLPQNIMTDFLEIYRWTIARRERESIAIAFRVKAELRDQSRSMPGLEIQQDLQSCDNR